MNLNPKIKYFCTPEELHRSDIKAVKDLGTCTTALMEERARGYQAQINLEQSGSSGFEKSLWLVVGMAAGYGIHAMISR